MKKIFCFLMLSLGGCVSTYPPSRPKYTLEETRKQEPPAPGSFVIVTNPLPWHYWKYEGR